MNESLIKKIISDLYSDYNIEYKSFELLNRKEFINNEWVNTTPSFFIGVSSNSKSLNKISEELSSLTGCEINMFRI